MFEKIAVAIDGSAVADRALDTAIEVARRFGSGLTLLTVQALRSDYESSIPWKAEEDALRVMLEQSRERARGRGVDRVEVVYRTGHALEEILDFAHRSSPDLLVVGSRGLSRGSRLLLGSVSSGLVQSAHCPVLVVRPAPG